MVNETFLVSMGIALMVLMGAVPLLIRPYDFEGRSTYALVFGAECVLLLGTRVLRRPRLLRWLVVAELILCTVLRYGVHLEHADLLYGPYLAAELILRCRKA